MTKARLRLILILSVFAAGALLRVALNNVKAFSPADESVYVRNTGRLVANGLGDYPGMIRDYLADKEQWVYPDPLRWGYYVVSTTWCRLSGACEARTLANLSTFAGILALLLTWLAARELLGADGAIVAAILAISSPLQLALGRRALQDELVCASSLLLLWLVARLARRASSSEQWTMRWRAPRSKRWLYLGAILAAMLMISIKESTVLILPAITGFLVWRKRSVTMDDAALVALPPALFFAGFCLISKSATAFFTISAIVHSVQTAPYAVQYQSGPWHRPFIDMALLAPIAVILAIAGIATAEKRERQAWSLMIVVALTPFLFASKNLRYIIMIDPMMRIAAAWFVANRRMAILAALLLANLAAEWWIFRSVFVTADVYDPITSNLVEALQMIPTVPMLVRTLPFLRSLP